MPVRRSAVCLLLVLETGSQEMANLYECGFTFFLVEQIRFKDYVVLVYFLNAESIESIDKIWEVESCILKCRMKSVTNRFQGSGIEMREDKVQVFLGIES